MTKLVLNGYKKKFKKNIRKYDQNILWSKVWVLYRSGEDTKGVIKSHILNKNRQYKSTEGHGDKQWSP